MNGSKGIDIFWFGWDFIVSICDFKKVVILLGIVFSIWLRIFVIFLWLMFDNWMWVLSFFLCNLDVFLNFFESRGVYLLYIDFVVVYVNFFLYLVEWIFVDVLLFLFDYCLINVFLVYDMFELVIFL